MFGLLKGRGNAPFVQTVDTFINAPAETVYRLLDFASPEHRLRQRGFKVVEIASGSGRYKSEDPGMPGLVFFHEVAASEPYAFYAFVSEVEGDFFGELVEGRSEYRIAPEGAGACRVELTETSLFTPGLSRQARKQETAMMTIAVNDDIARLKMEAEGGFDAS